MKTALSSREQRAMFLVVGSGVIILWFYAIFLIGPLMREAGALREQMRSARDQLKTLQLTTSNETMLQEQSRQLDQSVMALRRLLPDEEELSSVIERLSDLASRAKVKIVTISPRLAEGSKADAKGGEAASPYYKAIPIQIDAEAGYHQLGSFLGWVESDSKPMRIFSLKIAGDAKEPTHHRIKLVILAYFASGKKMAALR